MKPTLARSRARLAAVPAGSEMISAAAVMKPLERIEVLLERLIDLSTPRSVVGAAATIVFDALKEAQPRPAPTAVKRRLSVVGGRRSRQLEGLGKEG